MSYRNKVLFVSLGLLMLAAILAYVADPPGGGANTYSGLGYMMLLMMATGIEVFILLVIGIIFKSRKSSTDGEENARIKQQANAYFLAMGLVLLVGASLCFGGATLVYG